MISFCVTDSPKLKCTFHSVKRCFISFFVFVLFCWSVLYSAIFRSRADSLRSHVILHEWIAFFVFCFFLNAFLNNYTTKWCTYSVGMAGATWNCCRLGAFCVHLTTMHHVTSCKATYVRCFARVSCQRQSHQIVFTNSNCWKQLRQYEKRSQLTAGRRYLNDRTRLTNQHAYTRHTWQNTISQSACAYGQHHLFNWQFYSTVQNHFRSVNSRRTSKEPGWVDISEKGKRAGKSFNTVRPYVNELGGPFSLLGTPR